MRCYCCSEQSFENCCQPIIEGQVAAATPEQLMRSRFSAYCTGNYAYILATYANAQREQLSVPILEESAQDSRWFALQIDPATTYDNQVTFRAFYFAGKKPAQLHETSLFVEEDEQWRYKDGTIHRDSGRISIGRNDRCPCASGKKFKQCCLKHASG